MEVRTADAQVKQLVRAPRTVPPIGGVAPSAHVSASSRADPVSPSVLETALDGTDDVATLTLTDKSVRR